MKKIFTIITIFIAITIAFTACNKDEFNSENSTTENSENPQDYKEGEYVECKVGVDLSNGVTVDEEEMWGCGTVDGGDLFAIQIRENNSTGKVIAGALIYGTYINKLPNIKLKFGQTYFIEATLVKDGKEVDRNDNNSTYGAPFLDSHTRFSARTDGKQWIKNPVTFKNLAAQSKTTNFGEVVYADRFYYCKSIQVKSTKLNITLKRVSAKITFAGSDNKGIDNYPTGVKCMYYICTSTQNNNRISSKIRNSNYDIIRIVTAPNIKDAYRNNNFKLYYGAYFESENHNESRIYKDYSHNFTCGSTKNIEMNIDCHNLPYKCTAAYTEKTSTTTGYNNNNYYHLVKFRIVPYYANPEKINVGRNDFENKKNCIVLKPKYSSGFGYEGFRCYNGRMGGLIIIRSHGFYNYECTATFYDYYGYSKSITYRFGV